MIQIHFLKSSLLNICYHVSSVQLYIFFRLFLLLVRGGFGLGEHAEPVVGLGPHAALDVALGRLDVVTHKSVESREFPAALVHFVIRTGGCCG